MFDRDRLLHWIESIPLPHQAQKRRRSPSPSPRSGRKRCRLPTPAMSSSSASADRTPSKRGQPFADGPDEETPRASRFAPAYKKSRTTQSSPRSSKSSSGRSPTKTLAGLAISTNIIPRDFEHIRNNTCEVLGPALHKVCDALPKGILPGIVPESLKANRNEYEWLRELQLPDTAYYHDARSHQDITREMFAVQDIVQHSDLLFKERGSEVAWNEWVHSPVLLTALRHRVGVVYRNVSTASVWPKDLLVPGPGDNPVVNPSRITDFAICIDMNDQGLLFPLLQEREAQSVNATNYECVCLRPIAISIETKRPDTSDGNKTLTQLASWTIIQYKHLQRLLPNKLLPGVPMLTVLAYDWLLYFFVPVQDRQPSIFGPIKIGNTRTHYDTYRLLASLRVLADWAATDYHDWWVQVLKKEAEGHAASAAS